MSGTARDRARRRPSVVVVGLAAIGLALLVLPLLGLLGQVAWRDLGAQLTDEASLQALRLSLVCSLCATGLAVAVGLPLAWILARVPVPGRSFLRGLVLLPMVLPPVVGGVALLSAFSRQGLVGRPLFDVAGVQLTFTTAGVILAEAFVALPFFVITAEAGLRTVDVRYEEAAASLGARRATVFRRVTLPLVLPSLAAGAVLAWARALGEFGATITFAGNIEGVTQTLPLAIYLQHDLHPERAVALSLVLIVISLAVLVALRDRWLAAR